MTLRAKESRAETITGGLSVLTVRHVRPDMTASDVLAAINMVRRVLIPGRIYHVPGGEWYDRTRIDPAKGEPWFCTEEEARAVGWRPAQAVIGDLICTSLATPIAKGRRP